MRDSLLDKVGVDGDALGAVVSLVDAYQPVRKLKHVGPLKYTIKIYVFSERNLFDLREMMMN